MSFTNRPRAYNRRAAQREATEAIAGATTRTPRIVWTDHAPARPTTTTTITYIPWAAVAARKLAA